jgi:hypothetical protein
MLVAAVDTVGGALMAVYVLLAAALVSLSGVLMLVAGRRGWVRERRRHGFPPASPGEGVTRARVPFSRRVGVGHAEAALTARLFAGKLDSADYRQAMAELAADDSVRHPVVVPRDRGGLGRGTSQCATATSTLRGARRIGSDLSSTQSPGTSVSERVVTYEEQILEPTLPGSIVIAGAGAIGVEFAYVLHNFGVNVTIVEFLDRVVPLEDEDVSAELARRYRRLGIDVLTSTRVESIDETGQNVRVTVSREGGAAHPRGGQSLAGDGLPASCPGLRARTHGGAADRSRRHRG